MSPPDKKKKNATNKTKRKVFDPTESAGLGLLNEMSLVETKVRLEANERRRVEAEEARRREILLQRAEKEADLRDRYGGGGGRRVRSCLITYRGKRGRLFQESAGWGADHVLPFRLSAFPPPRLWLPHR